MSAGVKNELAFTLVDIGMSIKNCVNNRFDSTLTSIQAIKWALIDKTFSKKEIEDFLDVQDIDINDKAIVNICKENDMILFTNDRDFKNSNVAILSNNPRVLY